MKGPVSPIRSPDGLAASTVELRFVTAQLHAVGKKLDRIVERMNATVSGQDDELHEALAEHNAVMSRYIAALTRIAGYEPPD